MLNFGGSLDQSTQIQIDSSIFMAKPFDLPKSIFANKETRLREKLWIFAAKSSPTDSSLAFATLSLDMAYFLGGKFDMYRTWATTNTIS